MKCQTLFNKKNKKDIADLLSAKFAQRVGKINLSLVGILMPVMILTVN